VIDPARVLLDAPRSPLADPVARLDAGAPPPPDVARVHAAVRGAIAEAIDAVADGRRAEMVLVTGEPGMGKTHQLAWLRARAGGEPRGDRPGYACVDVPPLKDAGAPFTHLARYVVQGLSAAGLLERILWDLVRRVAAAVRAEADDQGDDDVVARIDQALVGADHYALAFRALAQEDPGLGPLLYQRGRRLPPLATLPAEFGRVACRITDRAAERAIVDWLRAAELPDEDLALLDVRAGVDGEDRAFEVVRALATCTARPLVICLDQLESTAGLLGADGVARLFTALMELYQQAPLCIVLMCQPQQWIELRRDVPQAALDRVRVLPPLAKPTADEAAAIVASRLEPLWAVAAAAPPYPSWPFSPAFLTDLVGASRPTIRQVLIECEARLADMRRAGRVVELALSAPPGPPTAIDRGARGDRTEALRALLDRYARAVGERRDLGQPKFRQEHLREALLDVLRGAARFGLRLGGIGVASVAAPPKPRNAPRPPAVIALDGGGGGPDGPWRLALDVHGDEARFAYHVLERLHGAVADGGAESAVLVREADAPLGDGARRSLELARTLAETGGGVVYLARDVAVSLVAAGLFLDAAQAAEVLVDGRQVSRDEALAFVLGEDPVVDAVAAILPRAVRIATRAARVG